MEQDDSTQLTEPDVVLPHSLQAVEIGQFLRLDRVANFRKLPRGDESLSLDRNWARTTAEFALRKAPKICVIFQFLLFCVVRRAVRQSGSSISLN